MSRPGVKSKWLLDGKQVTSKDGYKIEVISTVHTLSLDEVTVDDGGKYTIKVEDKESSANLYVKGTNN